MASEYVGGERPAKGDVIECVRGQPGSDLKNGETYTVKSCCDEFVVLDNWPDDEEDGGWYVNRFRLKSRQQAPD